MWPVLGIMLLCGAAGGIANFWRAPVEPASHPDAEPTAPLQNGRVRFGSSLFAAEIAVFIVPLFLSLASCNLVSEAEADGTKRLVFAGFCLVAATLSNRFTDTVSQRVLSQLAGTKQEARAADTRSKQVQTKQKQIEAALTEPDNTAPQGFRALALPSDEKTVVLHTFEESRYPFRSLEGIAHAANLPSETVEPILGELVHSGQLATLETEGGVRWYRPAAPTAPTPNSREADSHAS